MAVLLPEPNKLCFLVWQTRVKNTITVRAPVSQIAYAPLPISLQLHEPHFTIKGRFEIGTHQGQSGSRVLHSTSEPGLNQYPSSNTSGVQVFVSRCMDMQVSRSPGVRFLLHSYCCQKARPFRILRRCCNLKCPRCWCSVLRACSDVACVRV